MFKKSVLRAISRLMPVFILIVSLQLPQLNIKGEGTLLTVDTCNSYMKRIDSGWGFTLAVTADGRVAAWGDNTYKQCDVPLNLNGVVAVSAGQMHSLALRNDGTIVAWGDNSYGQCNVPEGLSGIVAISAGGGHSLALKSDGTVVTWGGISQEIRDQLAVPTGLSGVKAISAGAVHSLALKNDGTVVAWGFRGNYDQNLSAITVPSGLNNVVAISAPWNHNLAIKSDGTVVAWGSSFGGQLSVPSTLSNIVAVSGSVSNSMALKSDGTVVAWGGSYSDYQAGMFTPPGGLTGVVAISSEDRGSVALKSDGTIASWGQTAGHLPNGSQIIPTPRIIGAQLASDNSYIDVNFNMGVYGAGLKPLAPSDFQFLFNSNGGEASAVVSSIKETGGADITGGETTLRFFLNTEGAPTGEETIEIKPANGQSIYDSNGNAMDGGQTTRPQKLNAFAFTVISSQMAGDNTYVDVNFNMGVYGDISKSTAVTKEDFTLAFAQNTGSATDASISSVRKNNCTDPNDAQGALTGGETTLRFFLNVTGAQSGEETITINPVENSVYSPSGAAMPASRTTGAVKLSPPVPAIISTHLASDNSYLDVTFNTGIYANSELLNDQLIGTGPVTNEKLRVSITKNSVSAGGVKSIKKADSAVESIASELKGGEKTVRIFLDIQVAPTGEETAAVMAEGVFNSAGIGYSSGVPVTVKLNAFTLGFGLPQLAQNNRYLDVNFNMGVYGANDGLTPVSASDFKLVFRQNGGNTGNVTIKSIKKPDSSDESKASSLSGGETTVRFFFNMTDPPAGHAETIEIKPFDGSSVFSATGIPMTVEKTTRTIYLFESSPDIVSAQLAQDNSYIDVNFNFGVYGDSSHTMPVTPQNFSLIFYSYNGQATAASISSIRKNTSTSESDASTLEGGESTLRFFLDLTGVPSGTETIRIEPVYNKPIYNSLGKAMLFNGNQTSGEFNLNGVPQILSAYLAEDMSYLDVYFSAGVYGNDNHTAVVEDSDFNLGFARNSGTATDVTINKITKTDGTTSPSGGDTVLRFFLNISGSPNGLETIEVKPASENLIFAFSGNAMAAGQTTNKIHLAAPSPEIVSAQPAADNSYIDVSFNLGIYGDEYHLTRVSPDDFKVSIADNGGDAKNAAISGIKKPDNPIMDNASDLKGGEKTVRIFLYIPEAPSGGETIEIKPAYDPSSTGDKKPVCSYSGKVMSTSQTTGAISLVPFPKIISEKVAADNSYVDVTFNTGVYGDALHSEPLKPESFSLTYERNGGGMITAAIKSVKKNDGTRESNASLLTGGEQTVRVYLSTMGTASGNETIAINKKDGNSIFDKAGHAIAASKFVQPVRLNSYTLQIISANLSDDNSYVDVSFNGGVYGAPDGSTKVTLSNFVLADAKISMTISSLKKADGSNDDPGGGETALRFFLKLSAAPSGAETFEIMSAAITGGLKVYNASGEPMALNQTTGPIKLNDMRPRIVSAEISGDNRYVDIHFNTGIYGDSAHSKGVTSTGLNKGFYLDFEQNGGGASGVSISSIKKADNTVEGNAAAPQGGETTLRFFLNVTGTPTGEETITINPNYGDVNNGAYDAHGYALIRTTDKINLAANSPMIVSSVLAADNSYIDVNFSTGVYGNQAHTMPVTSGSFQLLFNRTDSGKTTNVEIESIKKIDGATGLSGGEKAIRLILKRTGAPNGAETIEIKPANGQSVYSSSGNPAAVTQTTGVIHLNSYYPKIVSAQIVQDNSYIDVSFNTGVYDEYHLSVRPEDFDVIFNSNYDPSDPADAARIPLALKSVALRQNNSTDLKNAYWLQGGAKTLRFFLEFEGEPSGEETIRIQLHDSNSVFSIYGIPGEINSTGVIALNAPPLKIVSVSAAQKAGISQYVDVNFNMGVYGDTAHLKPVTSGSFQLSFVKNNGNASNAVISGVARNDGTNTGTATPLKGGEKTLRFFIYTYGAPNGEETIEIKPAAGAQIYNISGRSIAAEQTTNTMKLADNLPQVVSVKQGSLNKYMDISYNMSVKGSSGSLTPVEPSDFQLVFKKNGGSASNIMIKSIKRNDSAIESEAYPLNGTEKTLRFFLEVTGVPSGNETIEIKPAAGSVFSEFGDTVPATRTTNPIHLLSPYPSSWSAYDTSGSEAFGWMSDVMISAGYSHTIVMKNDGTVVEWGDDHTGGNQAPADLTSVKAVSAGRNFSLALKRDGTLVGWGAITVPTGLTGVKAIAAGLDKAFVLMEGGTVYFFNTGAGNTLTPVDMGNSSYPITAISAGLDDHLLALRSDGTVAAWGNNYNGQCNIPYGLTGVKAVNAGLGYSLVLKSDGTVVGWGGVRLPAGLSDVASISAGSIGYLVLKTNGNVELYDLAGSSMDVPQNLAGAVAVSAGMYHYTAIKGNGDVVVWMGSGWDYGQLDIPQGLNIFAYALKGTAAADNSYVDIELYDTGTGSGVGVCGPYGQPAPLKKENLKLYYVKKSNSVFDISISSIKRPDNTSEALASNVQWGDHKIRVFLDVKGVPSGYETFEIRPASSFSVYSNAGNNLLVTQTTGAISLSKLPSKKYALYGKRIDAGWDHSLAIKENGVALAWGNNTDDRATVPQGLNYEMQVSAGYHHSVALNSDGTVRVWGENYYGQCNMPYGLKNIAQVSAGGYHTLAVNWDGKVTAWGDNFYSQCNVPAELSGVIQVAAGGHHSLALKADGTVVAWGDNYFYQCDVPAGLANVISIAAGEDYSLALKTDGTVVAWGDNSQGQCDIPQGLADVKVISAGYRHCLGLKADGTVTAWGDNSKAQCAVPSGLTGVVAISAGAYFSIALKETGNISAWGDNSSNQCDTPLGIITPGILSSSLSDDDSYIDITFNKGVYGASNGSGPLNTESFSLNFTPDAVPGGASAVTIKSVKKNDSTEEGKASALSGGETTIRIFLTVTGYASGKETIELKPKNGTSIFDLYGEAVPSSQSAGVLTLKKQNPPISDIRIDSTSDRHGAPLYGIANPGGISIPVSGYYDTYKDENIVGGYFSTTNTDSIDWNHTINTGAGNNRILIVGLYSSEPNAYSQEKREVTFDGKPMTPAGTVFYRYTRLDLYYMLDKDLPSAAGTYKVFALYKDKNNYLAGHAVLLCNAAQQGPESIAVANSFDTSSFEKWSKGTMLTTLTDNAMVVEMIGNCNSSSDWIKKKDDNDKSGLSSGMAVFPVLKAGAAKTGWETLSWNWADIAVSIRSAKYPVGQTATALPPTVPSKALPEGDSVAFETNNSPNFRAVPIQFGTKAAAVGYTQLSISDDGETWGQTFTHPAGSIFSAGGKLFNFSFSSESAIISSSSDGISWTGKTCSLPKVTAQFGSITKNYAYSGFIYINNVAVDNAGTNKTFIAVGNAEVSNGPEKSCVRIWLISKDNGATWTAQYIPEFRTMSSDLFYYDSSISPLRFKNIMYFGDKFIAYDDQNVYYTLSGDFWIQAASFMYWNGDTFHPKPISSCHITGILERNGILALTGKGIDAQNINLYTSTGGDVWRQAEITYKDPKLYVYDPRNETYYWNYNGFESAAYARNTFAAAGGNYIAVASEVSANGSRWSLYALDTYGCDRLDVFNNKFYLNSRSGLLSSENLRDWYLESPNYRGNSIRFIKDKAYTYGPEGIMVGYVPMSVDTARPENGDIGVPVNGDITVSFKEGIKPGSNFGGSKGIKLKDSKGNNVDIACKIDNGQVIITPVLPLEVFSKYTVVIPEGIIKNTSDTKTNRQISYSFTTEKESGKPAVGGTSLGTGTDVPADAAIMLNFDRPVYRGPGFNSITIAPKDRPLSLVEITREISGSDLVLKPVKSLLNNTTYIMALPAGSVKDSSGNESALWKKEFTAVADTTGPKVESTSPANFGERVSTVASIKVIFNEDVQKGDQFDKITLQDIRSSNKTGIVADIPTTTEGGSPSSTTLTINLPAQQALVLHSTYRVTIPAGAVKDMVGNPLTSQYSFVFTEEIRNSFPVLLKTSPGDNDGNVDVRGDIAVLYDRSIGEGDGFRQETGGVTSYYIKLRDVVRHNAVEATFTIKDNKLTVKHASPLDYNTVYELIIPVNAIADKNGDNEDPTERIITFTTEKQRVVSSLPQQQSAGTALNSCMAVKFDGNVSKSYQFNNVTLKQGGVAVASRLMLDGDTLLITPETDLSPNTAYSVEIPRGAVRFADLTTNNYYTFSFTTGSVPKAVNIFTMTGTIELINALFEEDQASFDASGCISGAVDYYWDFGDGTEPVHGGKVTHTFGYRGNYSVCLVVAGSDGKKYTLRKLVNVLEKQNAASTSLDVTPKSPVSLNAGDSADFIITLSSRDIAIKNASVDITRTYPLSAGKNPEPLATVTTDNKGMAVYRATLPENCPEYYIAFKYNNVQVRRVLKSAVGKSEISGYVLDDRNRVQKNASVTVGSKSTTTDDTGFYRITDLDTGTYGMKVSSDLHYDDISDISLTQKSIVRNITLVKIIPSDVPVIKQVLINNTAAGTGQNFYFLKGIDANINIRVLVDWKGNEPDYIEFKKGNTAYKQTDFQLSLNAGKDLSPGEKLTAACVSKDGARSQAFDLNINLLTSLPGDFPFELDPVFVDGKYISDRYINLTPVSTPVITSIPIIKGGPFSFLTDPVHVYGEMGLDGTFHAVVGKGANLSVYGIYAQDNMLQKYFAKKNAASEAEKAEIDSRQSKSFMGSVDIGGTVDASFYWAYNPSAGSWSFTNGTLHLGINADAWGTGSYGIPGIPLNVYLRGEFKVLMDTFLSAYSNNGTIAYNGGMIDLRQLYIEIAGGISAGIAKAEVYFSGDGKVRVQFPSNDTDYYIEVKGGVRASMLFWSVDYDFLTYSWGDKSPWVGPMGANMLQSLSKAAVPEGNGSVEKGLIPGSTSEFKLMSRDYLKEQSQWQSAGNSSGNNTSTLLARTMKTLASSRDMAGIYQGLSDGGSPDGSSNMTLKSNTYPYTDQNIIPYNNNNQDGAFMVLVEDDSSRSDMNRTRAEYSVYNGSAWSAPLPIDPDDTTADFKPVAARTGSGVIAAWENLNGVLSPEAQLQDALAGEEISVGTYNSSTGTWSDIHNLTSDSYLDSLPKIAASGNKGILVWTKNKSNDYGNILSSSYTSDYDIMFSKWNGSSFGSPVAIASLNKPVVSSSVAYNGSKGIYVFTLDEDNNINTVTDQELYMMIYNDATGVWSAPVKLSENTVKDSNPQVCFLSGKMFIVWDQDGKIVYTDNAEAVSPETKIAVEKPKMQDAFVTAIDGNGTLAVVGPGSAGSDGQDLYEITYDAVNGIWGNEIQLTSDNSLNRSPSAAFTGKKLLTVYNRGIIVDSVNPANGQTYPTIGDSADLKMTALDLRHDFAVSSDGITLSEDNPSPGSLVTVNASVENKGTFTESGTQVAFYAGNPLKGGQQIGQNQVITDNMAPGTKGLAYVQWEVPSQLPADGIFVVVDPGNLKNDANLSNNTAFMSVLQPDLELSGMECTFAGDGKYIVKAKVSNISAADISGSVVSFHYGDSNNNLQPIDTIDAGALQAGEAVEVSRLWSPAPGIFKDGKVDLFATVDKSADGGAEGTLDNNVKMLSVKAAGNTQELGEVPAESGNVQGIPGTNPGTATEPKAKIKIGEAEYAEGVPVSTDKEKGITTASLSESIMNEAFSSSEPGSDGIRTVSFEIPEIQGTDSYVLQLPVVVLSSADPDRKVVMKSEIGAVTFTNNMLKGLLPENSGNVGISIGRADISSLRKNVRDMLGDRPVVELKLLAGDRTIAWENPEAPVTVSIHYTPTAKELADPEHITVWYIDGTQNIVSVPSGRYDPVKGVVTFTTTHFSNYAVAYVVKSFGDLGTVAWARSQIEVLASKGIIKGLTDKKYSPASNITRADYLYSLVRALGLDAKVDGNFSDIKKDAYYYKEIAVAKKLGITDGTGKNMFSPNAAITRQDMIVLTVRALKMLKKLKQEGTVSDLKKFADKSRIASYAVDFVASAVKEGLIEGSGNKVNPLGKATRAEAAVFLYRIYNKY